MKLMLGVTMGLGFWITLGAARADGNIECYEFQNFNNPAAMDLTQLPEGMTLGEKWCYQKRGNDKDELLLIFNGDSDEIKPELSTLVSASQRESSRGQSIGSLYKGTIRYELLQDQSMNPFVAPLTLNDARSAGKRIAKPAFTNEQILDELFQKHQFESKKLVAGVVQEGNYSAAISNEVMPWNGFWWSFAGLPMSSGPNSPLGVYDSYVLARTEQNPNTSAWENRYHVGPAEHWGGHCNGWAASASLYTEPTHTLYDPLAKRLVTPYAQKGMLAEASYCLQVAFYGNRYNGRPGDLLRDIKPDLFHKVLIQYIRDEGKPVTLDYAQGVPVDNHIITGYRFDIRKTATNTFHVNTVLTVALYDIEQRDSIGHAKTYERPYSYTLSTDNQGNILSGKWDDRSENPDFLWVPLTASENCSPRNSGVKPSQVSKILQSLPEAHIASKNLDFSVNQYLIPQGQIPVPLLIEAADNMRVRVTVRSINPAPTPGVILIVSGKARYPITGGIDESMFIPLHTGSYEVPLDRLLSIHSFAIVNQSLNVNSHVDLTVHGMDYLGP